MTGNVPDFQHRCVLESMQRMSIVPPLKGLSFVRRAITRMQAHAPMRGGVGDGVIFGF
jgi:hypothetical protein